MVNGKNVTKKKKMEIVFYLLVNQSFSIKVKQVWSLPRRQRLINKIPNACALTDQYSILSRFT